MDAPSIAFWPHSTRNSVASYRIRCAQIRLGLAARGFGSGLYRVPTGALARLRPRPPVPGLLVLSKRTDEASLARALALRRKHGTRLVLDISDNVFFGWDAADAAGLGRFARLSENLGGVDAIVTPSDYLRDAIAAHVRADMRMVVIPDAVEAAPEPGLAIRMREVAAFHRLSALRGEVAESGVAEGRRLIWYGISGTRKARNGLVDLDAFSDALERHNAVAPISVTIVTDRRDRYRTLFGGRRFRTWFAKWNYWTFHSYFGFHDIALLPVRQNDYNWAKSANRLTTAFANDVAVCASAIPSYAPFARSAVLDDWDEGLARLMDSRTERDGRVRAGRALIETDYTLDAVSAKWADLFTELLGARS